MSKLRDTPNRFQGAYKKVLCVCSAGILRSPTTAWVLGMEPYNYNTRSVGVTPEHALIPLTSVHLSWCDEIVVMESWMADIVKEMGKSVLSFAKKPIIILGIEDLYCYRDIELISLIKMKYTAPET